MNIRQKIHERFKALEFKAKGHTYSHRGKKLKPVSNVVGEFHEEFDTKTHAARVAKREGVSVESIIKMWADNGEQAAQFGTDTHDYAEMYAKWKFFGGPKPRAPRNGHEIAAIRYLDNLPKHIVPVGLEVRMFSEAFDFAGTCDLLLYNYKTQKYRLADYKTNKDIFKNYNGNLMYPPFQWILDMPYNHYQLQLSLYHMILQECGYEVESREIVWLKGDQSYTIYETKDFIKLLKQHLHDNRRGYTKSAEPVLQGS